MNNREVMQQALEALELGYDAAKAEADQYHAAMAGYRPERHARMDAEVQQIAAAITALKAALAEPQDEPAPGLQHGWVLREVLFDNGEPISHREPQSKQTLDGTLGQMHFYHSSQSNPEEMIRWDGSAPLVMTPRPEFQRSTQRQPLTQYEAWEIWDALADRGKKGEDIVHAFARAIEDAVWEKINGTKT